MLRPILIASLAACATPSPPAKLAIPPGSITPPGLRLPDGVTPLGYELRLEVDPDRDTFRGEVHIRVAIDAPIDHVWIHAVELEVSRATFHDGEVAGVLQPLALGDQMRAFGFGRAIGHRTITLDFAYTGHVTGDEEGLFREQQGDRWYLFSQAESVFARRIAPCFDEPRWKTPWQVTLIVPADQVALANMPVASDTTRDDGRRELAFAVTPPMPSYLVAIAVGPFALVDAGTIGRAKVPVRVAAIAGDRGRVGVVAAQLPAIATALESYLDHALPWPKLDIVEVPHLFGAMENSGLVTIDASYLVGDASRFVRIAAHEVAHQWFGNLVTPAWWDDLWLSEAFASWLGDKVWVKLGALDDPALRLALSREQALDADAAVDAKPLRRTMTRNSDPDDSYDEIAYQKGEAVLATFEAWIGETELRAMLRRYLRDHRDGTVTSANLIAAITPAAVGAALASYVAHVGAPVVRLALHCDGAPHVEAIADHAITVPVCVRYSGGRACALVGGRTELPLAACPTWIYGNDENGYYHVAWIGSDPTPPIDQLSPSERIARGDDLAAAVDRGDLAIADALAAIRALAKSRDPYTLHAAVTIARTIDASVDDATRAAWSTWLATRFADRLTSAALLESRAPADVELRDDLLELVPADHLPLPTQRAAARDIARSKAIDPLLVQIAAPLAGRALFDRLVALAATNSDVAFEALGDFGADMIEPALALVTAGELPIERTWSVVAAYFERGATRTAAWHAVRAQLPAILARMTGVTAALVIDATAHLCDPAARAEVVAAFEPRLAAILDGRRRLDHALAVIDRCIAHRADVAAALQP